MSILNPSKMLCAVYDVLRAVQTASQYDEIDPGMFAPESIGIKKPALNGVFAMLQREGLIDGVETRRYVGSGRETVVVDWDALCITLKGLQYLEENNAMIRASYEAKGIDMSPAL